MRNLMEVAYDLGLGKCSHCDMILTGENIAGALEDYGINPQNEETRQAIEEIDHITLCCPTYSDEKGCLGYSSEDREKAAYWYSC